MIEAATEGPQAGPVLVGGTGRSGTTIVGELLGARSDLTLIPIELRFQCDPGGLGDLATGVVDFPAFRRKLMQRWFKRAANSSGPRGVHVVAEREHVVGRLRALRSELDDGADRALACGRFLDTVIAPWAERAGAREWIEMTPPNAAVFDRLAVMLPTARFVHMMRDGRDVAASVARRSWGPDDLMSAVRWWGDRMVEIGDAIERTPSGQVLTLRLEALVGEQRDQHFATLEEFVGRGPDPAMRAFFEERMSSESARPGSWSRDLTAPERAEVDASYAEQVARLDRYGFPLDDPSTAAGEAS